jgi:FKBP-type peptidyl-prolyl cis-trans isomerase FkpA
MLNIVKLPVLWYKKVNLLIIKQVMNRLLWLLMAVLFLTACEKEESPAELAAKQAAIDDELIADYLRSNNINATKISSRLTNRDTIGVWYVIEKPGTVSTLYSPSSRITVGYTGSQLGAARPFASTGDIHPSFVLGEVMRGWQLGIPQVNRGGIIRLIMASRYAYGPYEQPNLGLPANALLDFRIEVFDVTN